MDKSIYDSPLIGQGKTASGGTYNAYGPINQENVEKSFQEYLEALERMGLLEPALKKIREKEKASAPTETK